MLEPTVLEDTAAKKEVCGHTTGDTAEALSQAIVNGCDHCVSRSRELGANPHASSISTSTPVHHAIQAGNVILLEELLQHSCSTSQISTVSWFSWISRLWSAPTDVETYLNLAVKTMNVEVVRCLLRYDADVNQSGLDSKKPIHLAVESSNSLAMVQLLVCSGAELNFTHPNNIITSAIWSGGKERFAIIQYLFLQPFAVFHIRPIDFIRVSNYVQERNRRREEKQSFRTSKLTPMHYSVHNTARAEFFFLFSMLLLRGAPSDEACNLEWQRYTLKNLGGLKEICKQTLIELERYPDVKILMLKALIFFDKEQFLSYFYSDHIRNLDVNSRISILRFAVHCRAQKTLSLFLETKIFEADMQYVFLERDFDKVTSMLLPYFIAAQNGTNRSLIIRNSRFTDEGWAYFTLAIDYGVRKRSDLGVAWGGVMSSSLAVLELSGCGIDSKIVNMLVEEMPKMKTLQYLNLDDNNITENDLRLLCSRISWVGLKMLSVANNIIYISGRYGYNKKMSDIIGGVKINKINVSGNYFEVSHDSQYDQISPGYACHPNTSLKLFLHNHSRLFSEQSSTWKSLILSGKALSSEIGLVHVMVHVGKSRYNDGDVMVGWERVTKCGQRVLKVAIFQHNAKISCRYLGSPPAYLAQYLKEHCKIESIQSDRAGIKRVEKRVSSEIARILVSKQGLNRWSAGRSVGRSRNMNFLSIVRDIIMKSLDLEVVSRIDLGF